MKRQSARSHSKITMAGRDVWLAVLGLSLLVAWPAPAAARRFNRCQLVHELRRHGFPEPYMRDWVCLVESESSGDTAVVSRPNYDGSRDFGLFQISDRYWCAHGYPGGQCNVRCQDLITDDISASVSCVAKIVNIHGFGAWYGWVRRCYRRPLPEIHYC